MHATSGLCTVQCAGACGTPAYNIWVATSRTPRCSPEDPAGFAQVHALRPDKQRAVATETLQVWCSLAERLGMFALKACSPRSPNRGSPWVLS